MLPLPSEILAADPPSPLEFSTTFRGGGGGGLEIKLLKKLFFRGETKNKILCALEKTNF